MKSGSGLRVEGLARWARTPKRIHNLSYTLSHFANPNRTLFIPNPSGALLRRKQTAKDNAASGTIGECRRVRLGSAMPTFKSCRFHHARTSFYVVTSDWIAIPRRRWGARLSLQAPNYIGFFVCPAAFCVSPCISLLMRGCRIPPCIWQ
jgi:hypothetical protein